MDNYIEPAIEIRKKRILTLTNERMRMDPNGPLKPLIKEEYYFEPIALDEIVKDDDRDYIVVGESGIGKTTFLHWIANQISSGSIKSRFIPLFIELKDIAQINTTVAFEAILDTKIESIVGTKAKFKDYDLQGRRLLFLLDGLDQVSNSRNIIDRLKEKDIFGRENKIILATRPIGYEWVKDIKHEYLRILPFDEGRIKEYLKEDYGNPQFQALLNQNKELLSIPILLKIVKELLLEANLSNIKTRTKLYEKFIEHLIEKWEWGKKEKPLDASIDAKTLKKDLAKISYEAITDGQIGSFLLEKGLKYLNGDNNRLKTLIFWSVTHNLVEKLKVEEGEIKKEKVVEYTHESFQEYFAALELKERLFENNKFNKDILIDHLEYTCWDEILLFLVGTLNQAQAKNVIECIREYDPYLSARCLAEYNGNSNDFQELIDWLFVRSLIYNNDEKARDILVKIADTRIEDMLISLWKDPDWEISNLFARVNKGNKFELLKLRDQLFLKSIARDDKARNILAIIIADTYTGNSLIKKWKWKSWLVLKITTTIAKMMLDIISRRDTSRILDELEIGLHMEWGSILPYCYWMKVRDDEYACIRANAALILGKIKSNKAVGPLIESLSGEEAWIHIVSAWTLSEIKSKKAVRPLIELLNDNTPGVRSSIAEALGKMKSEEAIEPLIKLSNDNDKKPWDRVCAAEALSKISPDKAIEPLIVLLKDKDFHKDSHACEKAIEVLAEIKSEKVVEQLIELLNNEYPIVRRSAARALGKIKSEKAVEPLIKLLKDKDPSVRESAAMALGKIKSEKAVEPLISSLENEEYSNIHRTLTSALSEIGSEKAVEYLIGLLENEKFWVRENAIEALGEIKSERVIELLIRLLEDENDDVRQKTAHLLSEIKPERAIEPLIELLKDNSSGVRSSAAKALGEINPEKAVEPLIKLLKDKNPVVRLSAAEALSKIKPEKAIKPLLRLLKDEYLSAAEVLGEINPEKAVEHLIKLLKDNDPIVCKRVVEVLEKISKKLKPESQLQLGLRLSTLANKYKKSSYLYAFTKISSAMGRRFLKGNMGSGPIKRVGLLNNRFTWPIRRKN